ncbi:MAG: CD225/dispanin family protein [Mucilaginibacter polytrichastri]|nr:CD225/dispanin family protein [Mucilaginibacter polytrichastri]
MEPSTLNQPPVFRPKNWLVESILVTLFCCLPFGIAGIVFASQVNSKYDAGDFAGAERASKDAGKWTKIGFFIGIAGIIIYAVLAVLGVAGGLLFNR